jgi:allantoin racemase
LLRAEDQILTPKTRYGADVVVMGCAGMARYRAALEDSLAIPVVEPTQAAVAMAIGRVRLGGTAKRLGM